MRRFGVVTLALLSLAVPGMLAQPAWAQAPAPKVTISGFFEVVTSAHNNNSQEDLDFGRNDSLWATRQRTVLVTLAEVEKARGVLAFEIDLGWGMTGQGRGSAPCGNFTIGAACQPTGERSAPQLSDSTGGAFGNNNDVLDAIEIKQMYIEFPMPLAPWPTTLTLGGQPSPVPRFMFKPSFWNDDYPGVFLTTTLSPAVKANFIYGQFDEAGFGHSSGTRNNIPNVSVYRRGDDFAIGGSLMLTPMSGLDVVPFYVFNRIRGLPTNSQNSFAPGPAGTGGIGSAAAGWGDQATMQKNYMGLDGRWRSGPWSLDPTVIWLLGTVDLASGLVLNNTAPGRTLSQDWNAFFVDVRGGYRTGPLFLEAFFVYNGGNDARDNLNIKRADSTLPTLHYFSPITTGGGYAHGWSNFLVRNEVDENRSGMRGCSACNVRNSMGYDRYGLITFALRPSYALTRAVTLTGLVASHWTAEDVDTDGTVAGATGLTPETNAANRGGDDNYLGTELGLKLTWAFAPRLTFDMNGGYFFTGDALGQCRTAQAAGRCQTGTRDPRDAQSIAARVRFSF